MHKGTQKWSLEYTLNLLFGKEASFIVREIRGGMKGDPIDFYRDRDRMRSFASGFVKLYENKHDQYMGSDYLLENCLKVSYYPLTITNWFREAQVLEDLFPTNKLPESTRVKIKNLKEVVGKDFDSICFEDFARADFWLKTEFFVLLFGEFYSDAFFPTVFKTDESRIEELFINLENYLQGAIETGEVVEIESLIPTLLPEQYLSEDNGIRYKPDQLLNMLQRKSYPVPQELLASLKNGGIAKSSKLLKSLRRDMTCLLEDGESSKNASALAHLCHETVENDQELFHQNIQFNKKGQVWSVSIKGETPALINAIDGMSYIDHLLKNPGKEIPCLNLYYEIKGHPGEPGANNPYSKMTLDQLGEHNLPTIVGFEETENIVSKHGMAKTLEALKVLKEKYEALEGAEDTQSQIEQGGVANQIEAIEKQLGRDTNHLGKSRKFPSNSDTERARSNVSKALNSAIKKIEHDLPRLAKYLDKTIKRGSVFHYLPSSTD